ncbi:unnamed protein product, partial [Phaeothamnion confervicola]
IVSLKNILCLVSICLILSACNETYFKHELKSDAKPWTKMPEPSTDGQFTFAVIGDLTGGERKGVFDIAAQQLSLLKPKFILSIGDLIEGSTEDTTELKNQYDTFDQRMTKAGSPFFHVGGNHDLTSPKTRSYWEKRYGRQYYHFVYENILFLVLNSEDFSEKRMIEIFHARNRAIELLDSGKTEQAEKSEYFAMPERVTGEISDTQSAYFENVIQQNPNVRWTFLFMHKPVWQREGVGNLDQIEAALSKKKYTLFNGHFHNYSYTERNGHDYIMMGTTGGGQDPTSPNAFDHITLVTMAGDQPSIVNVRLDGMLDKKGQIPMRGDTLCFQTSACDSLSRR